MGPMMVLVLAVVWLAFFALAWIGIMRPLLAERRARRE